MDWVTSLIERLKNFLATAITWLQAMEEGPYGSHERRIGKLEAMLTHEADERGGDSSLPTAQTSQNERDQSKSHWL